MSFGWCVHLQVWCLNVGLLRWNDLCSSQDFCNNFATLTFSFKQHFRVVMDVMCLKLTTFLTHFFLVVVLGYMWWWYHHTRLRWKSYGWHCMLGDRATELWDAIFTEDSRYGNWETYQKKRLGKLTELGTKSLWNKLKVVKLCNTCISHWIWFWTWWRTWGVYCFYFIHRCFLDLIPFLRWNQPSSWQQIRTLL